MSTIRRVLTLFLFCLLVLNPVSAQGTSQICNNLSNYFSSQQDIQYADQLCQEINNIQATGSQPQWLIPAVIGILFYVAGPVGFLIIGMLTVFTGLWWVAFILGLILILMPFGAIFWIVYGFLRELRIFKKTEIANIWIALTAATAVLFPLPIGILGLGASSNIFQFLSAYAIVMFYFRMLGWVAMIGFFMIFTAGVYYYYLRKKRQWSTTAGVFSAFRGEVKNLRMELAEISEAVADAAHKLAAETDPNKRVALEASLRELQDRRRDVQERLTELHESTRNM